jgi:hypothetical protein
MAFDPHLFGDASASSGLSEEDIRRVVVRAERRARYGRQPADVVEMRQRAHEQAELARQIGAALEAHDVVSAQALIQAGAAMFGHRAMVAAVEAAARERQEAALEAAGQPNHHVDDAWWDDPEPYDGR